MRNYIFGGLCLIVVVLLFYSNHSGIQARQTETCSAVNDVKAALVNYIDQQIARSAKSLPTIEYYKNHPVELGKALSSLQDQREATHEAFAPTSC